MAQTALAIRKPPVQPSDYGSEADFVREVREEIDADLMFDRPNRDAGMEDSTFFIGKQWDDEVARRRNALKKPVMTENYLVAFVGQILGNRRLNETTIKVAPDNGGTKDVAAIREGLICNIQKVSNAEIAYDKALENQAICGIGNFMLELDWAYNDVFEQDMNVVALPNAFSVVWDRRSLEPTGKDATHVTIIDSIPEKDFKKQYPGKHPSEMVSDADSMGTLRGGAWVLEGTVRVAQYWRMRSRKRLLAMLRDGSVVDVTDKPEEEWLPNVVQYADGSPVMREAPVKYAEMYLLSGTAILEGPYELPISRLPVFRVPGWEVNVGQERHRWGVVRHLKDAQRGHNYWRSVVNEKLMATPRAKWIARKSTVEGFEKDWNESHLSDKALLIFADEAPEPPQRIEPAQVEPALIQEAAVNIQAMRDISNIHEASMGQQSNEVSGKAILARQRVGELGTVLYHDNLNLAICECGRVMNELIPFVYNAPRVIKITGADNADALKRINDPVDPESVDITIGKYAVTVVTGPSYTTKRVEQQESMQAVFNAAPEAMGPTLDLFIEAQDWHGADRMVERLRKTPMIASLLGPNDMSPEMAQAAAAAAEQGAKENAAKEAAIAAEIAEKQAQAAKTSAEVDEVKSKTELNRAGAAAKLAEAQLKTKTEHVKAASQMFRDKLEAAKFIEGDAGDQSDDREPE